MKALQNVRMTVAGWVREMSQKMNVFYILFFFCALAAHLTVSADHAILQVTLLRPQFLVFVEAI